MEFISTINETIIEYLGPLGPMILLGTVGLIMVILTVSIMLSQPEDPMTKLKKSIQQPSSERRFASSRWESPVCCSHSYILPCWVAEKDFQRIR